MINSWYNPYPVSGITNIQIYTGTVSIQFCDTTIYHPPLDIVIVFTLYHQVLLIFYTDVDECETNGTCPDHSTCTNTFGSFVCTCNEGFLKNGSVCIGKMWFWHLWTLKCSPLHPPDAHLFIYTLLQMWMNVRSMEPVQNTPPAQTPLVLLYALAMKDSWRMAVCALVSIINLTPTCTLIPFNDNM